MFGMKSDKEITAQVVEGSTEAITIPTGMSKLDAARELKKQYEDEESTVQLQELFKDWMWGDVLIAFKNVTQRTFGFVHGVAQQSFFGENPPVEERIIVGIENGVEKSETCFSGKIVAGNWDDAEIFVGRTREGVAYVAIEVKKKFTARVHKFFDEVKKELKANSIYKSKCLKFENGEFKFIEPLHSQNVVLNDAEQDVIQTFIINQLEHNKNVAAKRSILFVGPYGTGKTETATFIGSQAIKHGITYVYCKNHEDFPALLNVMKNYQPSIIFAEDVENMAGGEERDAAMNDILNTLDGIETKGHSITTIFTTNHENRINKAMRRPGRIDLIVDFKYLEKSTIGKIFVKIFNSKKLKGVDKLNLEELAAYCPDEIQGAVAAEIANRAVIISQQKGGEVTNQIVKTSIDSMRKQVEFMRETPENLDTPESKLASGLQSLIKNSLEDLEKTADEIRDRV